MPATAIPTLTGPMPASAIRTLTGLVVSVAVLVLPLPADASEHERILSFHSEIEVHADASLTVRETIRAVAAGDEIRQGIYRDFPTRYVSRLGVRTTVGFEVLDVRRDGLSEDHHLESRDNGTRVYIGRPGVFLEHGDHTFELAYRTTRQLGFFDDHDELYWNVTGNGWAFPIERASARVTLPGAGILSLDGYTGPAGETGRSFRSSVESGVAQFETKAPLDAGEGLTIVVGFAKGHVAEPTPEDRLRLLLEDNRGAVIGFGGLVVVLLYYLLVWLRVGRDPEAGPLVVRYEPPRELSPAAMRFLVEMGFDERTFAVSVIDMAVKGALKISERDGEYTLTRLDGGKAKLSADEKTLLSNLFGKRTTLILRSTNHEQVGAAKLGLQNSLKAALEKTYFLTNGRYLVPSVFLTIGTLAAALFGASGEEVYVSAFMSVWLTIWTIGVVALVSATATLWRTVLVGATGRSAALTGAIFMTLFSIPFVGAEMFGLYLLTRFGAAWVIVVLGVAVAMGFVFHRLLKAPTSAGRTLLDEVDGFRAFLTAVDADRLERMAPDRTPELFEKYLPYALALGVEQAWAGQFSDVLGSSANAYRPRWYSGDSFTSLGAAGFASGIGSSLSGAISSASTAPGSSSGGGGGGSSGGGGGGGGGGGW